MTSLFGGREAEGFAESRQQYAATFEAAVVREALRIAGGPAPPKRVQDEKQREHPAGLDWLRQNYPRFPVELGAAKIPFMSRISMSDLFGGGFMRLPFFLEYQKWLATFDLDDTATAVAFCFHCPNAPGASKLVLHNRPSVNMSAGDPTGWKDRNTRIVRPAGNPLVIYVIEPLPVFLADLGSDWLQD